MTKAYYVFSFRGLFMRIAKLLFMRIAKLWSRLFKSKPKVEKISVPWNPRQYPEYNERVGRFYKPTKAYADQRQKAKWNRRKKKR